MRLLAFDTSTLWCSVALRAGEHWLEREEYVAQSHSERVLPIAQDLLAEAGCTMSDLDAVAFGAGPGAFTGVRIATGIAQGLSLGLDRPAVPVSTLAALTHVARRDYAATAVLACIDARMGEVYAAAGVLHEGGWQERLAPCVLPPLMLHLPHVDDVWTGIGSGFAVYPDLASALDVTHVLPDARPTARAIGELAVAMLREGGGVDAAAALPVYLRHRVALTVAEREAGMRL